MRAGLGVAAALLLCAAGAEQAVAAAVCGKSPKAASIEVEIVQPEVAFDHSLSRDELTALSAQQYGHVHRSGSVVFGLTAVRVRPRLSMQAWIQERNGIYCAWPAQLTATVAYDGPIAVHVAREYRKSSCQHKAVLDHEMEHVAAFKASLRDYEKHLRKALERALDRGKFPVTDRDQDKAWAELSAQFEAAFQHAVAEAESDAERRNAAVDSPESYDRTRRRCNSW